MMVFLFRMEWSGWMIVAQTALVSLGKIGRLHFKKIFFKLSDNCFMNRTHLLVRFCCTVSDNKV